MARRRSLASRVAARLGCIAAIMVVTSCAGCADRLILYPTQGPLPGATAGLTRRVLAAPSGDLEVWIGRSAAAAAGPKLYVLAFDGNASRAEYGAREVLDRFSDRAVEVWSVNYPGYGGSTGPARLAAIPNAALLAYDEMARAANGAPIVVHGNSLGATAALHVAARRPVRCAVLQNPPPLRRLVLQRHGWWNLWIVALPVALAIPVELNATDSAPTVRAPAIVLSARDDDVVPLAYQDRVFEALGGPKTRIVIEGGHNDGIPDGAITELRAALRGILD